MLRFFKTHGSGLASVAVVVLADRHQKETDRRERLLQEAYPGSTIRPHGLWHLAGLTPTFTVENDGITESIKSGPI